MKHLLNLPNMAAPDVLVELAVAAEESGWDGVSLWDHVAYADTVELPLVDPWVVLGAIAHATDRIRIGTMITPLSRRRPWRVAQEVTTLDHLSHGRAVLGVGLGWPADEDFARFGEVADDRVRAERLDEALDVLGALWSGERVRHEGTHFTVDTIQRPAPVQRPHPPVWVAGMWPHPAPFRRAARWDGVVAMSASTDGPPVLRPDEVAALVDAIRRERTTDAPFDVVVSGHWENTEAEFADAGATWLVSSWDAEPEWVEELGKRARHGPG